MARLRLAFMGAPAFAVPTLAALLDAGHDVVAVYTQPPRPAGRGQRPRPSPVQALAQRHGLEIRTPATLQDAAAGFAALRLDAAVVVAYGLLLPPAMLAAPRLGCLNVHASLLPRWRGAAPIQHALLAGDPATGITIMQMDRGLDTGDIVLAERLPVEPRDTAATLSERLAPLGARLPLAALAGLETGALRAVPQPASGVTHAPKLTRADGRLDWRKPAVELERKVRAFDPWPGAWFELLGERVRVLAAEANGPAYGPAGRIAPGTLAVACGDGLALDLLLVQRAGRRPLSAPEFLRGRPLPAELVLA